MRSVAITVEPVMPSFDTIVCTGKLRHCSVIHVPQLDWIHWNCPGTSSLLVSNVRFLEVVKDRVDSIVFHVVVPNFAMKVVKCLRNIWNVDESEGRDHSHVKSEVGIVLVQLRETVSLNTFPDIL